MINISNFQIDKKKDSHENCLKIKNYIDEFIDQKPFRDLLENYALILDYPIKILEFKSKQILSNSFSYEKGEFLFDSNLKKIFLSLLIYLGSLIYGTIFSRKINTKKKSDIILDDVDHIDQIYRFKKLLSMFENSTIITKKTIFFANKIISNCSIYGSFPLAINSDCMKDRFLKHVSFSIKIFSLSIKYKFNFFHFFNRIFFSSLKYETLFSKFKSKFLIHDRFFKTCSIRDYIFKKKGGLLTTCTQMHLPEASTCLFAYMDVLFSFGQENFTKNKFLFFGGNIKKTISVGSLKMEHMFFDSDFDSKKIPSFDVLIIGLNYNPWLYISDKIYENYFEHLRWVVDISLKNPKLKIAIKHHENFRGGTKEQSILKNTNIETILNTQPIRNKYYYLRNLPFVRKFNKLFTNTIYKKNTNTLSSQNSSYFFLQNSKLIFSFGSTMILEGLGNNKDCYFLDPNFESSNFFQNLSHLNSFRIKNFSEFEKIIKGNMNKKNMDNEKKDLICLKSENVSSKIYNYLKNFISLNG